jgi:uncharacterized membrane protein
MNNGLQLRKRVQSIDVLRGIIMVIMALDHTRDFFHISAMTADPTNMAVTTPVIFFTRWITHFCAPVFLFLAGTSAFLNGQKKTKKELSIFLLTRGLWLIALEVVLMSFLFTFNPFYNLIFLEVIWVSGISMVLLALLIYLPYRVLLLIGLLIFFGHNLLDYPEAARAGKLNFLWSMLHARNVVYNIGANHVILVGYSFLPWTGLMILGYCFGKLYAAGTDPVSRKKILILLGFVLILLFVVLRYINVYGDPAPWAVQRNSMVTLLSFMNVTKYPPSLIFSCMTIGPAMLVLAFIENIQNKFTAFFNVYGRVPMFYFIVHFFIIHLLCVVLFFASGYTFKDAYGGKGEIFGFRPVQFGYPLWVVYLIWISIVLLLYPLCKKYNNYKSTHQKWWLSYL